MRSNDLKPVILTYHSIGEGSSAIETHPSLFARQMEQLAAHARVAPLADVVEDLRARRPLPAKTVVLTFDDGYFDFFTHAAPVLKRHGFPATVFLPTGYCGKTSAWDRAGAAAKPLLDWTQVRALADAGVAFGSHSVSHPNLTRVSPEQLVEELSASKAEIQQRTGRSVNQFCYPYGEWNRAVREAVAGHYEAACSTGAGVLEANSDPMALPRVDACYVREPGWFQHLFSVRFHAYVAARRAVRKLRRKPEGKYARLRG